MMQFATCNATNMRLHSEVEKSLHVAPHFATLKMLYCEPQETCNNATQVFYTVHACSTSMQLAMFFTCDQCDARKS